MAFPRLLTARTRLLLKAFFLPRMTRWYILRVALVGATAYALFAYVCIPARARGGSMEPTYRDGSFTLCWRLRYLFSSPAPGDVVMVRLSGTRTMYLKRVVALAGDTVEFRGGVLFVNGRSREEPYVKHRQPWNLAARVVDPGHVYVVGDNRGMPMQNHPFGQTEVCRIVGGPLW